MLKIVIFSYFIDKIEITLCVCVCVCVCVFINWKLHDIMVNIDKHVSYLLKKCIYPSIIVSHMNCRKIILKHTHTHIYYMWLKWVRKFKGLRFILENSQIFINFFFNGSCQLFFSAQSSYLLSYISLEHSFVTKFQIRLELS